MGVPQVIEEKLQSLPKLLREHVSRVRVIGRKLSQCHGLDDRSIDVALAAHDVFRAAKNADLISRAREYGLKVSWLEMQSPGLLHGPVAAEWLLENTDVIDSRVIEAVRYHTTGSYPMSSVSKAVFLADKIDPRKVGDDLKLEEVVTLSYQNLDKALLKYLDYRITKLTAESSLIHPRSLKLRNRLVIPDSN